MPSEPAAIERLKGVVLGAASPDGGWPYYAGKKSRVEPTCWALMALSGTADDAVDRSKLAGPHLQWLARTQRADGLLVDEPSAPVNFTSNGLAACALAHLYAQRAADAVASGSGVASGSRDGRTSGRYVASGFSRTSVNLSRLLDALISVKGLSVNEPDPRQDNRLQGWPWMADTFSWLEPTAWCVLALKKAGKEKRGAAARIDEADKLIANRVCEAGGWNYGNASVVGQDLRPYVPTTAIALLAMRDRRQSAAVERSVAWLRDARSKEPSATALSLASLALRVYGLPVEDVEARLAEDVDRAIQLGNVQALAMMLYALTAPTHGVKALLVDA